MNISISYVQKSISIDLAPNEYVALYEVPIAYSDDSLYLARWEQGELEPVPACATSKLLLCLGLCVVNGDVETISEVYKDAEISYA